MRINFRPSDANEARRNVRVHPGPAHNFGHMWGEFIVIDIHPTVGWTNSLGFCGLLSVAVEHEHCNTNVHNADRLEEDQTITAHVTTAIDR